jgi:hypothetical protein
VYYADSCNVSASTMRPGMLKYTLDVASGGELLQLFVSAGTNSSTYGEVNHQAGEVVVPVMGKVVDTGAGSSSRNVTDSFGCTGGRPGGWAEAALPAGWGSCTQARHSCGAAVA